MHNAVSLRKLGVSVFVFLVLFQVSQRLQLAQENVCRERLLPTFVIDKDGNPVRNLSPSDFQLKNSATSMSVAAWNPDGRRHRVVILLDVSGSMRGFSGPGFRNALMAITQHVVSIHSENGQFALMTFSGHVIETVGFSQGSAAVRHRMEEISNNPAYANQPGKPGTAIFDAMKEGFHLLESPTSADSLLVITDGLDEGSNTKPSDLLALLSVPMVRVFSILMVDPVFMVDRVYGGQRQNPKSVAFTDLVEKSGGRVFGPVDLAKTGLSNSPHSAELRDAFEERLLQFYRGILQNDIVTVEMSSGVITKPEPLRLSLSDTAQRQWKHAQIFYPREIGACPEDIAPKNVPGS